MYHQSRLADVLDGFRESAQSEYEAGAYFEELIAKFLTSEARYRDLYVRVLPFRDWAKERGLDGRDAGIDLVAETHTGEVHAIQCKFYARDHKVQKDDIDSFFTASGKKPFTHRIIVATTNNWSEHAEAALYDQQPPVTKIDFHDLDNSQIDWAKYKSKAKPVLKPKKELRDHQTRALKAVVKGLASAERGKMIMACGTGKTFTSLKIAETLAGKGGRVLFLVPSLNLLSQTLTEWSQEAAVPLHCFAVCSDADVGKKRDKDDETVALRVHELRYPATTEAKKLADEIAKRHDATSMTVVFSTYHSIDTIGTAQKKYKLADFDLVICDEAHRTTGATFEDDDESAFIRVHDEKFVHGAKRLYMTATPRIYADSAKATAEQDSIALCSMDDESLYGQELYVLTFSEAVQRGLLVDYKVIVLAVEEAHVSRRLQELLKDDNNQLKVHDAARIVGCWKALSKQNLTDLAGDNEAMRRAVAFCQVIEANQNGRTHKVSSKQIAAMFQAVVEAYQQAEDDPAAATIKLKCEAAHVDGGMNATAKDDKLAWLKDDPGPDTCRILSNVRCLSEGVDVPALDAVLFLTPRNSQVDVVQSVGRVMRNAPGKKRGYVVLPVVIPAGMEPHEALNDNQVYRVVWQVLQALRSHDDRFDAMINKLDLIGRDTSKMEVIAVTDKIQRRQTRNGSEDEADRARGTTALGNPQPRRKKGDDQSQFKMQFDIGEIERAIYARIVKKCGNRLHWEEWAADIAKIAQTHIDRITGILENPKNTAAKQAFDTFASDIRDDLNPSVADGEIVEMLAQHMITKPVFEALFADFSFAKHNPMSKAMQGVLDVLEQYHIDKEADTLQRFYDSVKMRASGIENAQGKQKIVVELYDKFFRNAFPKMTERLGIVYTPVEVVDFIIHSVNDVLKSEFGETLGSAGVHIIDPFTGTGTFITRLLQSGLMTPDEIRKKYAGQLHANEIVLLAYYIAAINIESTYHGIVGGDYVPFDGICLTDTFQMYEKDDLVDHMTVDNSRRRRRQKKLDIRVIIGNPPYSIGQENQNDNNQNIDYPALDQRVADTYAKHSNAALSRGLYDSYVRAIRWASDRIGASGVVGFVTNGGFVDGNAADGLRKCLVDEFSSLYVFHLRGNARTSGDVRKREAGNVFGGGSRAPVAISLLVKNPKAAKRGQIHFHEIGDYLSREEKLQAIEEFTSIDGIANGPGWRMIEPDAHGDWLKQRDTSFGAHVPMGLKKSEGLAIFENFSLGVVTNRDPWCFNASKAHVAENVERMIEFYNGERRRLAKTHPGATKKQRDELIDKFINTDATKVSWTRALKQDLAKDKAITFNEARLVQAVYRPFHKQWMYFSRDVNEVVSQVPRIFPDATAKNVMIGVSASESRSAYSVFITDQVASLHAVDMVGSQFFPLYLYDDATDDDADTPLFAASKKQSGPQRRDAITDEGLAHFRDAYPGEPITKEDLFYYVYGLLHSPDYRERFADNLGKELPRIPRVKTAADFWAFSKAGRTLGELHINYEKAPIYAGAKITHSGNKHDYRVEKMRYGGKGRGADQDRTTLHYNDTITVTGIPLDAYAYVVNGKPALDWVVERQCIKTDKDSGIVNDANDWAVETMKNPKYPLELFLRVITVSLETMKIVKSLPALDIHEKG
jgi:predicted helicase